MNLSHPFNAISPTIDTAVLVALCGSREARSGRQVAQSIGRSQTGVQHVLDRLVGEGIVERRPAGRAYLYSFNYDHLLASAVQEMASARVELVRRLREQIGGWDSLPVHASMFGSAARGDGGPDSDIDVFLVRPREIEEDDDGWRGLVEFLAESIERWTGNAAGIVELSESRLGNLRRQRPPVLRELDRDAIDLAGTPTRRLLAKAHQ